MTAEEWLNDLETLADEAISSPTHHIARAYYAKSEAAQPETVKRLVGMVQALAERAGSICCPSGWKCSDGSHDCRICNINHAYQQAEPK